MTGHMPGHMRSLELGSGNQSQGRGSGHVLPSHVAPRQVPELGDRLDNQSGDIGWAIAIRWKNGIQTLHIMAVTISLSVFIAS